MDLQSIERAKPGSSGLPGAQKVNEIGLHGYG